LAGLPRIKRGLNLLDHIRLGKTAAEASIDDKGRKPSRYPANVHDKSLPCYIVKLPARPLRHIDFDQDFLWIEQSLAASTR
jgi:hypothetical protein